MSGTLPGSKIATGKKLLDAVPVISTSIYASGDALGGKLTFSGAAIDGANSGRVSSVTLTDKANQRSAMDLILFAADFTPTNDNAAFAPSGTDLVKLLGVVKIAAADWAAFSANAGVTVNCNLPFDMAAGSTTIYGQLVARGTPTYASTSDISVRLLIEQD